MVIVYFFTYSIVRFSFKRKIAEDSIQRRSRLSSKIHKNQINFYQKLIKKIVLEVIN